MGFFSSIGNALSSVARAVKNVASSALKTAKNVASKAINWMAEKAENFVDGVKKTWQAVKPFVDKARNALKLAAHATPIPWLKSALFILEKGIGALVDFENSPIAKKVNSAIQWAIELAKKWNVNKEKINKMEADTRLSEEELTIAKKHQENLRFAEREVIPEDQRYHLELASAINDYEIAKAELSNAIDSSPADFEHYLRLRATQKLLNMADTKFRKANSIDDISADDLFLVRIASDLIKEKPELSQESALKIDRILTEKYGKKLTPFVFEELIASWAKRSESLSDEWEVESRVYARNKILLKRLSTLKNIQNELTPEEEVELEKLEIEVPQQKSSMDVISMKKVDIERYVGAAEGFLQLLEKSQEDIEAEDKEFLIDDGANVGEILIRCAEHNIEFISLNSEEQSLITDYSNVFKKESAIRMNSIIEITA